jgi:aminopeptidase
MPAGPFVDPRWLELAEILVGYSTAVRPGDRVLITMVEPETFPLVRAVHAAAVRAGGNVQVELQSALLEKDLLRHGTPEQVASEPALSRLGLEWADVNIGVRGTSNPHLLRDIPADRVAAHRRALGTLSALRTERTRWVLVRVPSDALAQQAGVGLDETMGTFFDACLRDWEAESLKWRELLALFDGASTVRITGPGTDLAMAAGGRRFLLEDGRINMPGGELYTSPVEDSASGTIELNLAGAFAGQTVTGISLRFRDGLVVDARAATGGDLLTSLLAMDEGAARIGELGVGLNAGLGRLCGDPLLDEKILGTAHIALGRSYAACGGKNHSALHWDLVFDLGTEWRILADGRPVFERGAFVSRPTG